MALRTDGNFESTLDDFLAKYLGHLKSGAHSLEDTTYFMKAAIMAAMKDERRVYSLVGEGEPIIGDDDAFLDEFEGDDTGLTDDLVAIPYLRLDQFAG